MLTFRTIDQVTIATDQLGRRVPADAQQQNYSRIGTSQLSRGRRAVAPPAPYGGYYDPYYDPYSYYPYGYYPYGYYPYYGLGFGFYGGGYGYRGGGGHSVVAVAATAVAVVTAAAVATAAGIAKTRELVRKTSIARVQCAGGGLSFA